MARDKYQQIIALIVRAADLARKVGINNLLQPGLVKEMIIADHLGHQLITKKHDADACSKENPNILYEYLSCKEGGSGQFDRMFKEPPERRKRSLQRIRRNHKIYFAVFYKDKQTKVKTIYEIEPRKLVKETERQLNISRNAISHVGFREPWARENGTIVYLDSNTS